MKLLDKILIVVKGVIFSVVIVVGSSIAAQQAFAAEGNADPVEYCEVTTSLISQVLDTDDTEKHTDIIVSGVEPFVGVWNHDLIQTTVIGAHFAPMISIFEGSSFYDIQRQNLINVDLCVKQIEMHAIVHGYDLAEGYPGPTAEEKAAMGWLLNAAGQ